MICTKFGAALASLWAAGVAGVAIAAFAEESGTACAPVVTAALPAAQGTETPGPLAEVEACLDRNEPRETLKQTSHFTQVDLAGTSNECEATTYEKRFENEGFENGRRKVRFVFEKPADLQGIEYVMHQNRGRSSDRWIYRPGAIPPIRRMPPGGGGDNVPCTNFSGEDLTRRYRVSEPARSERLPDTRVLGRPSYVLVTYPKEPASDGKAAEAQPVAAPDAGALEKKKRKRRRREEGSEYDKVVSYVDREACIVLSEESWKGDKIAKLLTVDPDTIERHDYVHYAATQRFEDCLEGEHTDIRMEEPFLDCDIAPKVFDEKSMGQRIRRPRCQ